MANASILAAFERMWQHVLSRLSNYYTKAEVDAAIAAAVAEALATASTTEVKTYLGI